MKTKKIGGRAGPVLKKSLKSVRMKAMKTFYDVQQFLKQFGIIVYVGKRLYDIELMKLELSRIYDAGLMDKLDYLEAEAVLRREHKIELDYIEKNGDKNLCQFGLFGELYWRWRHGWGITTFVFVVRLRL